MSAYTDNLPKQIETLKSFKFGVEIETIGAKREVLAKAVAKAMQLPTTNVVHAGGYYDKWTVALADGRKWTLMSDASLSGGHAYGAEVVTPILTYADMEMLQVVIRAVKDAGANVDASCGIHVHVDAAPFDGAGLVRLAKLVYQQEELIIAALGVQATRLGKFCKRVDDAFIKRIESQRPRSKEALAAAWYGGQAEAAGAATMHYHQSRYHGLNLHSVQFRGTVEFRYFEGTLHAGEVKSYVQLCLAIAAKALLAKGAVARKRTHKPETAKYDFRVFLLRLALIGDEFKTARQHLLKRCPGSASWKNGRPAPAPAVQPSVESAPAM